MSTVKATNFQNASSSTANMVTDASGNVSFGGTAAMSTSFLRNRIINGDMRVDQRNAGASVTLTTNGTYTLDRWICGLTQTSKFSVQQNAGAVTPPVGFINYLGVTSLSAYSVVASDIFFIAHRIEGLNISDLAWGTANAATVTVSFWVRSSLTGTFGGSLQNSGATRAYPFTFTINSSNTWELKTITIAGDTSGTWLTTNGQGINVNFSLGTGSTFSGTAGAWASANYTSATGATSVVGTNGATLYITGVQLEVGTVATPFERQIYSNQLAQCQRYYYRTTAAGASRSFGNGFVTSSTLAEAFQPFPVTMRDEPSALEQTGTAANYNVLTGTGSVACSSVPIYQTSTQWSALVRYAVASGLTTGQAIIGRSAATGAYLGWSAEL